MNPKLITVGYEYETQKHYAYFCVDRKEMGYAQGETQEEAVTKLADILAERLLQTYNAITNPCDKE